ncbi:SRPBCC family protein [Mycobacterium sp.]|uniref:SRPBCC family protein n=1 Tax=Mycobacterium sp. TaxID=1785 RepID=UPI003D10A9AB
MTPPAKQRTVTHLIGAAPADVYAAVTDVVATAAHSEELVAVAWTRRQFPDRVTIGDQFTSDNSVAGMSWTATSTVTAAEPGRRFAFAVSGPEHPTATWTFELSRSAWVGLTEVIYTVELGDGPSMLDTVANGDPIRRAAAETRRLDSLARDMAGLLDELDSHSAEPGAEFNAPT